MQRLLYAIIFISTGAAAEYCRFDYRMTGIGIIFIFYVLRDEPVAKYILVFLMCCLMSRIETFGALSLILIDMYNKKRGSISAPLKMGFYIIYPAHLLILGLIRIYR